MIGSSEILVVLLAALFIFGPAKLPELARAAGKAFADFKKAQLSAEMGLSDLDMYPAKNNKQEIDEKVRKMATLAGIDIEDKTVDEILHLIEENARISDLNNE